MRTGETENLRFGFATAQDANELAGLHNAVAERLTQTHGRGPWSSKTSERGILFALRTTRMYVARRSVEIAGTFRLTTKKPWAIDTRYFTPTRAPIYLVGMAVKPALQKQGIGRACLDYGRKAAFEFSVDAIRLDAFDAEAGAGGFYARCGYCEVGRASYRGTPLIYYELLL